MLTRAWKLTIVLAALPLLVSCEQSNERGRSAVEISAVNFGGVFVAGMINLNNTPTDPDDDFVPSGHVPVTVKNRPGNGFVVTDEYGPYGHFHITNVAVTWDAADSSTPLTELVPFNYSAPYDFAVPMGTEATFNVNVVPLHLKDSQYFIDLRDGFNPSFLAVAHLAITGHDSGSERSVTLRGAVIVEFVAAVSE